MNSCSAGRGVSRKLGPGRRAGDNQAGDDPKSSARAEERDCGSQQGDGEPGKGRGR